MTKTTKKVFKVIPELRAQTRRHVGNSEPSVAAPFDTPSSILITLATSGLICEFLYDLGQNEPTNPPENLAGVLVTFGRVSGRVMRLEIPKGEVSAALAGTAEEFKIRRLRMPVEPGTPLRRAAHYQLVGAQLLPGLNAFVAEQLPELRRLTNQ